MEGGIEREESASGVSACDFRSFRLLLNAMALGLRFIDDILEFLIGHLRQLGGRVLERPVLNGARQRFGLCLSPLISQDLAMAGMTRICSSNCVKPSIS